LLKFGVIAEGVCDQIVIENILIGCFPESEPVVIPFHPPQDPPGSPGGWTRVFNSLARGDVQQAFSNHCNYVVIHIDTDVQEEAGFDVPRCKDVAERVKRVVARLEKEIDPSVLQAGRERILFAVAVDSIECWLLPLLYDNDKSGKTTGCLGAANFELRKRKEDGLGSDDKKFPPAYESASKDYRKQKKLRSCVGKNPSLRIFVEGIDGLTRDHNLTAPGDAPATASD